MDGTSEKREKEQEVLQHLYEVVVWQEIVDLKLEGLKMPASPVPPLMHLFLQTGWEEGTSIKLKWTTNEESTTTEGVVKNKKEKELVSVQ